MKTITTIFAAVLLTACTVIPNSFDSVGYNNLVSLKQQAEITLDACSNAMAAAEVKHLVWVSKHEVLYVTNTREDTALTNSVTDTHAMIVELDKAYTNNDPGAIYCTLKMQLINDALDKMVSAVGDRQR